MNAHNDKSAHRTAVGDQDKDINAASAGSHRIEEPDNEDVTSETLVSPDSTGLGSDIADKPGEPDRKAQVLAKDFQAMAKAAVVFICIIAGLALAGYLLKFIWVGLLPVLLAILLSTVLYPVAAWLRSKKVPRSLAAILTILGFLAIFVVTFTAMGPAVAKQSKTLVDKAESGVNELVKLVEQSPMAPNMEQVQSAIDQATTYLKGQASNIASGVMSGVSIASSIMVALLIMLFVTFFIIKDGDKFLPWLRKYSSSTTGWHVTEMGSRIWRTLSGFIQAQAAVAFVDAVLIGAGLWILQVPLAFVIAVVTFFASFIPIIGAVTAGFLAVAIALVSNGLTNALLALGLIVLVQQIEGNVLQPMLQSKAMGLHAAIVLLSVTIGSTLAGIIGAFLAVPVAATLAVCFRYHAEMAGLRAGEIHPDELEIATGAKELDSYTDEVTPRMRVKQLYRTLYPGDASAKRAFTA